MIGDMMNYFDNFVFVMEILSVISFAISGSMTALKKNMDMFGVIVLGVLTATGGGAIRDIVLGTHPPKVFINPTYALIAAATSAVLFLILYYRYKKKMAPLNFHSRVADTILFWFDTLGLAIFTTVGIATAYEISHDYSAFLLCFVGVITGVGGGLICDTLAGNTPRIFVRHIYATACIAGAVVCVLLWVPVGRIAAMICGAVVIVVLRFLARHFEWNYPRIRDFSDGEQS